MNGKLVLGRLTTEQREFLQSVLEVGIEFLEGDVRDDRVLRYAPLEELKAAFAEPLPEEGTGFGELLALLRDRVAAHSVAQSDFRYLAFPDTGNSVAGLGADIVAGFLNQNLIAVDRSAPAATMVEAQLLLWLRDLVGYSTVSLDSRDLTLSRLGGMWTPGGNLSNTIALLAALHARFPETIDHGLTGMAVRPAIVLARGIEHFSFPVAAPLLGIGRENVLWAEPFPDFTTDPDSVRRVLDAPPEGRLPFVVVAVAGNCRTTGIDDIRKLREVADEYGVWLHVDACHGGSLLFSRTMRGRLAGIECADSVSLDPHKGLFVTYPSSYVLFRDPDEGARLCRYREKLEDPECLDLGLVTPFFGSRGFHSLKLWMLVKHLGRSGLGEAVDRRAAVNASMTRDLEALGLFTLLHDNRFYRQAFVFLPEDLRPELRALAGAGVAAERLADVVNRATLELCEELYRGGRVCFDSFALVDAADRVGLGAGRKYSTMGMAIGHTEIPEATRREIWGEVSRVGARYRERMVGELAAERGGACGSLVPAAHGGSPASW